jgi:hypothetical protein
MYIDYRTRFIKTTAARGDADAEIMKFWIEGIRSCFGSIPYNFHRIFLRAISIGKFGVIRSISRSICQFTEQDRTGGRSKVKDY